MFRADVPEDDLFYDDDIGPSSNSEQVDDDSRLSLIFTRSTNDNQKQRNLNTASYWEAYIDPDKPRYIKAVYDSQRPVQQKKATYLRRQQLFIQTPRRNTFLFGRTKSELFYCCSYYLLLWGFLVGVTAGFVALHMHSGIVSIDQPRFTTQDSALSLIGNQDYPHRHYYGNPGLAFRPLNYDDSNLIWFIPGTRHPETWAPLVGSLDAFLEHYSEKKMYGCTDCKNRPFPFDIDSDPYLWDTGSISKMYCCFYIKDLGRECTKQRAYGYVEGKPCILLKLNRIINWMPLLYENRTDAPEEIRDRWDPQHIGVKCFGVGPVDQEHIGELGYWPPEGFPWYYYPYRNQKRHRSPLVFVQFLNATPGVLIMVECRAYARNIEIDGSSMIGSVRFELLIDVSQGSPSSAASIFAYSGSRQQLTPAPTLVVSHQLAIIFEKLKRSSLLLLAVAFIVTSFASRQQI